MMFMMLVEEDADIDGSVQFMQVQAQAVDATTTTPVGTSFIVPMARQIKTKKLPPGCPSWASMLNDCEVCTIETKARLTNIYLLLILFP